MAGSGEFGDFLETLAEALDEEVGVGDGGGVDVDADLEYVGHRQECDVDRRPCEGSEGEVGLDLGSAIVVGTAKRAGTNWFPATYIVPASSERMLIGIDMRSASTAAP